MEEKPQIKTGLFGGSFNPIHTGHLALANYLCEYGGLEEVWFLVTPQNPFKQNETLLDDHLRLKMVEAAVAGYPVSAHPTLSSNFHVPHTLSIPLINWPSVILTGSFT